MSADVVWVTGLILRWVKCKQLHVTITRDFRAVTSNTSHHLHPPHTTTSDTVKAAKIRTRTPFTLYFYDCYHRDFPKEISSPAPELNWFVTVETFPCLWQQLLVWELNSVCSGNGWGQIGLTFLCLRGSGIEEPLVFGFINICISKVTP